MELNKEWFLEINSLAGHSHFLDEIMILSAKGVPFIFALMLVYLWFSNRKNESLFVVHSVIIGLIINTIIHIGYFHPRPFVEHLGILLIHHNPDTSFPSDHTTLSFSVAFMLLMFQSTRRLGLIAIILAFMCGVGRIYVGVHWPFDVIGGIIIGFIASSLVLFLKNRLQYFNNYIIDIWNKVNYGRNN